MLHFIASVGTEELAHWELLGAMLMQCLRGTNQEELKATGMDTWYANYGIAPFPANSTGQNWTAAYVGTTGDPVADLTNDMAAEQKARAGYEGALAFCNDPDIIAPLEFLREREIVHFQRFGEALNVVEDYLARHKK